MVSGALGVKGGVTGDCSEKSDWDAQLVRYATSSCEIVPEALLDNVNFDVGINEAWAKENIVGVKLEVPEYWWPGWTGRKKCAGKIVGFDPSDKNGRCFLFCLQGEKKKYPMTIRTCGSMQLVLGRYCQ